MPTTDRKIGQDAVLNGNKVKWAGDHYGWQSLASHEKLQINGDLNKGGDLVRNVNQLGRQALQVIQPALTLPGIKQTMEVLNEANENAKETYYNPQLREQQGPLVGSINQIVGGLNEGVNTVTDYWAGKAKDAGIHPDIGRWGSGAVVETVKDLAIGGAATKLTKVASKIPPGPGMKPALAIASAGNNSTLPSLPSPPKSLAPQVMELTIKDPKLIAKGVKKGSASSPEWLPQTRDFDMRRAALREKVQSSTSTSGKKNATSEMYNGVSTGPTRDPKGNPHVYQDEAFKEPSLIEKKKDGSAKWKEQHHLFSKQESFQFVERMVELGDDDDVLNMFLYAEDLDATMGGRLKNMLNMERKPHNLLHTSRKRKIDGRELKSDEMRNLVESAKTSTELMQLFNKYVTGNVTDSISEAKAFNEIGNRMIKAEQYGWINELYDKNILRKPVYRPY